MYESEKLMVEDISCVALIVLEGSDNDSENDTESCFDADPNVSVTDTVNEIEAVRDCGTVAVLGA